VTGPTLATSLIGQHMNVRNPRTGTRSVCRVTDAKFSYGTVRVTLTEPPSEPVWFIPSVEEIASAAPVSTLEPCTICGEPKLDGGPCECNTSGAGDGEPNQ
jgi:hypothetical protein